MIPTSINLLFHCLKPERWFRPGRLFFFIGVVLAGACTAHAQAEFPLGKMSFEDSIEARTDLKFPENLFMEGIREKMVGNTDQSFQYFSNFAALYPGNATVHYELARIWLDRNNIPKALKEIQVAQKSDSTNKWIRGLYADLLAFDGQYIKAAREFSKLARMERHPEDYLLRQAMLYQKAERYKDAIAVLDTLGQHIGIDDEMLLLQKQQLYLSQNDREGAAGELRKLIRFYPQESRYVLLLADMYEENDQPDEAHRVLQSAATKFPGDPAVQYSLLQYYLKRNDTSQFENYLEQAVMNKNVGIDERIGLLLPFIQYSSIEPAVREKVVDLAGKMAAQEPLQTEALMLYADLMSMDGRLDSALVQYKRVVALDTLKSNAWQQILYIYISRSSLDSLTRYADKAIHYFPGQPVFYYLGGIGYHQLGNTPMAITYLNKAIDLDSKGNDNLLSDILMTLGDIYNSEQSYTQSDSCYRKAIVLNPDNATALNNFSYYLSQRGVHLEEAEKMSARSLEIRPDEATFMDTYGWILYRQGKYKEARVFIQQAIDKDVEDADATLWEHLGDIEYKLGNTDKAVTFWRMAYGKDNSSDQLLKKINDRKLHD